MTILWFGWCLFLFSSRCCGFRNKLQFYELKFEFLIEVVYFHRLKCDWLLDYLLYVCYPFLLISVAFLCVNAYCGWLMLCLLVYPVIHYMQAMFHFPTVRLYNRTCTLYFNSLHNFLFLFFTAEHIFSILLLLLFEQVSDIFFLMHTDQHLSPALKGRFSENLQRRKSKC